MSQLRRQVLNIFKKLHRTRQDVFQGDKFALTEGRKKINESFQLNKNATDEHEIKKMIKLAEDVDTELRTNIIQATRRDDDTFELHIRPETTRLDNVIYNPDAIIEPPKNRKGVRGNNEGCCGGAAMAAVEADIKSRK